MVLSTSCACLVCPKSSASDGPARDTHAAPLLSREVNLPELLAHTAMDPETVTVLKLHMSAFLSCVHTFLAVLRLSFG